MCASSPSADRDVVKKIDEFQKLQNDESSVPNNSE